MDNPSFWIVPKPSFGANLPASYKAPDPELDQTNSDCIVANLHIVRSPLSFDHV